MSPKPVLLRLSTAKGKNFNLVLTAVNMPNLDGLSLLSELRRLPGYKGTPLLMLTTESGSDKKQSGKDAGATGWIVKPFNPEQMPATPVRECAPVAESPGFGLSVLEYDSQCYCAKDYRALADDIINSGILRM